MQFDPMQERSKSKDDWYPTSPKPKHRKRKLILLPTRKYVHSKGTMKRVRVAPAPAVACVVMRWVDGESNALPTAYVEDLKLLILADDKIGYVFNSRSEAKRAIYHTVQREGVPGGHVDFQIVNK